MEVERKTRRYEFHTPPSYHNHPPEMTKAGWLLEGLKVNTSAHGIPQIESAKGRMKKTFWTLVIFLTVGAFVFSVYRVFSVYLRRDVHVRVLIQPQRKAVFPAVTVCNMSPIKQSAIRTSPALQSVLYGNSRMKRDVTLSREKRSYPFQTCNTQSTEPTTGYCYTLFDDNKYSHSNAAFKCSSAGMHLAEMQEPEMINWQATQQTLQSASSDRAWIGLRKVFTGYSWFLAMATNTNWDTWQPNTLHSCVYMDRAKGYKWSTDDCSKEYLVLCHKEIANLMTTTVPSTPPAEITAVPSTTPAGTTTVASTTLVETNAVPSTTPAITTTVPSTTPVETTATPCTPPVGTTAVLSTTPAETTAVPSTSETTETFTLSNAQTAFQYTTTNTEIPTTIPNTQVSTESFHTSEISVDSSTDSSTDQTIALGTQQMSSLPPQTAKGEALGPIPGSRFPERIQPRESFVKEEKVTEILADLSEEEKRGLGFKQPDLIIGCTFDGSDCDANDFTFFYNTIHGNCYIFNSGWKSNVTMHTASKIGRNNGLSLVLNTDQEEYVEAVGDSTGVRILIHDQSRMPFPEEEGILTSPGYATSIGIKKIKITRMPHPYGDCIDPAVPRPKINVYEERFPVMYSTLACYKTCYQRHVIQRCGCSDSLVPKNGQAFNYTDVLTCDIRNITQDDCRYEVHKLYRENRIQCHCPRTCRETSYQTLSTRAQWPSDSFIEKMKQRYSDVVPDIFDEQADTKKYERNLIKVNIYYQDLNLKSVEEKPAYGVEKLFSDIGGLLGLLAGFSALTIFEFIEFLMDLLTLPCIKRKNNKTTDVTSHEENKMELPPSTHRRRKPSYKPSYIKQSAFLRQDKYADLFDLNH